MHRSRTFDTKDNREIGLYLVTSSFGHFFGIGIMCDSFHSSGRLPEAKILLLNSSHNDLEMLDAQFLSKAAGILSGPVALFSSRLERT